jgi:DNA-binding MarR family transcriptional regulator
MSRRPTKQELRDQIGFQFRSMQTEFEDLDSAVSDLLGLNKTDMRVLDFIGRTGGPDDWKGHPTTAGDVARASGLTTGAVTAVIDRLEKGGWVRRLHDPNDRRRVLVELTEQTERRSRAIWGPLKERGDRAYANMTVDQLEFLLDFLAEARKVTVERTEELREMVRRGESAA